MFWYDGGLIDSDRLQLNIGDPGLLYGATVFTTMRIYQGSLDHPLTSWQAHCDRLNSTLKSFNWHQPSWQNLRQGAELLLQHFPVLRMAIFPDGREWITGRSLPSELKQRQIRGITAWVAREPIYRRNLAQHKTGNYLSAYLARQRALSLKTEEAILIDDNDNWLETSTGNLWGWQKGRWYTPRLELDILPGIARSLWLNWFQTRQIEVVENIWTPQFIAELESVSYSNCVVEMISIARVLCGENRTNYTVKQLDFKLSDC